MVVPLRDACNLAEKLLHHLWENGAKDMCNFNTSEMQSMVEDYFASEDADQFKSKAKGILFEWLCAAYFATGVQPCLYLGDTKYIFSKVFMCDHYALRLFEPLNPALMPAWYRDCILLGKESHAGNNTYAIDLVCEYVEERDPGDSESKNSQKRNVMHVICQSKYGNDDWDRTVNAFLTIQRYLENNDMNRGLVRLAWMTTARNGVGQGEHVPNHDLVNEQLVYNITSREWNASLDADTSETVLHRCIKQVNGMVQSLRLDVQHRLRQSQELAKKIPRPNQRGLMKHVYNAVNNALRSNQRFHTIKVSSSQPCGVGKCLSSRFLRECRVLAPITQRRPMLYCNPFLHLNVQGAMEFVKEDVVDTAVRSSNHYNIASEQNLPRDIEAAIYEWGMQDDLHEEEAHRIHGIQRLDSIKEIGEKIADEWIKCRENEGHRAVFFCSYLSSHKLNEAYLAALEILKDRWDGMPLFGLGIRDEAHMLCGQGYGGFRASLLVPACLDVSMSATPGVLNGVTVDTSDIGFWSELECDPLRGGWVDLCDTPGDWDANLSSVDTAGNFREPHYLQAEKCYFSKDGDVINVPGKTMHRLLSHHAIPVDKGVLLPHLPFAFIQKAKSPRIKNICDLLTSSDLMHHDCITVIAVEPSQEAYVEDLAFIQTRFGNGTLAKEGYQFEIRIYEKSRDGTSFQEKIFTDSIEKNNVLMHAVTGWSNEKNLIGVSQCNLESEKTWSLWEPVIIHFNQNSISNRNDASKLIGTPLLDTVHDFSGISPSHSGIGKVCHVVPYWKATESNLIVPYHIRMMDASNAIRVLQNKFGPSIIGENISALDEQEVQQVMSCLGLQEGEPRLDSKRLLRSLPKSANNIWITDLVVIAYLIAVLKRDIQARKTCSVGRKARMLGGKPNRHMLVFVNGVKRAKQLEKMFDAVSDVFLRPLLQESGDDLFVNTVYRHGVGVGRQTQSTTDRIVEDFKTSKIGVLFNYNIFNVGKDLPIIDGVFFWDPTGSHSRLVQGAGRGGRVDLGNLEKLENDVFLAFSQSYKNFQNAKRTIDTESNGNESSSEDQSTQMSSEMSINMDDDESVFIDNGRGHMPSPDGLSETFTGKAEREKLISEIFGSKIDAFESMGRTLALLADRDIIWLSQIISMVCKTPCCSISIESVDEVNEQKGDRGSASSEQNEKEQKQEDDYSGPKSLLVRFEDIDLMIKNMQLVSWTGSRKPAAYYYACLPVWARDPAYSSHEYPKKNARNVLHPELPSEIVDLGRWIKSLLACARGTGNKGSSLQLRAKSIRIAAEVRRLLLEEYRKLGQSERIENMPEDWWKKKPVECVGLIPEKYVACLRAWAGMENFVNDGYPRKNANNIPHPERQGTAVNLGMWIHTVKAKARGNERARNNTKLHHKYLQIADQIREILSSEFERLGQRDRVNKIPKNWWEKEETLIPEQYAIRLPVWAQMEEFMNDGYPRHSSKAIPHPERPNETENLGLWVTKVKTYARGVDRGRDPEIQNEYLQIADQIREILSSEFERLGQRDRVHKIPKNWWEKEESLIPEHYAIRLPVWARMEEYYNHGYPKLSSKPIPHPERSEEFEHLGQWVDVTVKRNARGNGAARASSKLKLKHIKIAAEIRRILIEQFTHLRQDDRIKLIPEDWWKKAEEEYVGLIPEKVAARLPVWADMEDYKIHCFPKLSTRPIPHPERPDDLLEIGKYSSYMMQEAQGNGNIKRMRDKNRDYLPSQKKKIQEAMELRDMLLSIFRERGEHQRIESLNKFWKERMEQHEKLVLIESVGQEELQGPSTSTCTRCVPHPNLSQGSGSSGGGTHVSKKRTKNKKSSQSPKKNKST